MIFTPSFTAQESEDGKKVTITLTAFDVANTEGLVKANFSVISLILTDAYGVDLTTLSFLTSNTVIYNKTTDLWINALLFMSRTGQDYSLLQSYPTKQISQTKLAKVLQENKCCGKYGENFCIAIAYLNGARNDQFINGNDVKYQINIDNANAYLGALI